MTAARVVRPIVRSFQWAFRANASAWVRAGGHAIVWKSPRQARLVFAKPKKGDEHDLGWWSALDIGRTEYLVASGGPFSGLAYLRVPHDCYSIVRDRVVRDSIHRGPTRVLELDCLACGACCKDNRVVLEDHDIARFNKAGRGELARAPYAKRDDGVVVLVLGKKQEVQAPRGRQLLRNLPHPS